jgi:SOS response regulatory protein OraA/RecX
LFFWGSIVAKYRDADSPWKQILRGYLPDAMDFFFPGISELIDWRYPPVFLDKELEQLNPEDKIGKRYADHLVEVRFKGGESKILLLHIEIQASKDKNFEKRMLIYAIRIYSRFEQFPASLAILCDSNTDWRPDEWCLPSPAGGIDFRFKAVKLMDYEEQWECLESSQNPFAVVVMAHLKAEELKRKTKERKNWKFLLVRGLYEKGYNGEQVRDLYRFIDWIMVLPEKLDDTFWNELQAFEQEKKMTFITSVERIGMRKGREKERQKIVLSMLKKGVSAEDIAEFIELSIEQVKKIQSEAK